MSEQNHGMGRRGFLRSAGVGAVGVVSVAGGVLAGGEASAAAKSVAACKTAGCDHDVIVIGGGFAGVTAARDCRKNGHKTLLLEARNRLGGRAFTSTFAGHVVELGGAWIHWSQPNVWAEKERYGLELKETPEGLDLSAEVAVLAVGGKRVVLSAEEMASVGEAFYQYFADARQMWTRPYDAKFTWPALLERDGLSARDRIDQLQLNPLQRAALEGYMSTMGHSDVSQISYNETVRVWALSGFGLEGTNDALGHYAFKKGASSLIEAMVEDGKPEVRLSTQVRKIEDKGDRVVVTTSKGERLVARAVIVTVPMNVLPGIEFNPPLAPQRIAAGKEKHCGAGAKVYLKTQGKYEGPGKTFGMGDASQPISLTFTYAKGDDHAVYVAFVPDPAKLDVQDKGAMQTALRAYLPDVVVQECFAYEWTLDPFSQGTWAGYKPNWYGRYGAQFEQESGRVFFGQGDHGEGWRGFIDGAIGAGSRAAQRVKKTLGSA